MNPNCEGVEYKKHSDLNIFCPVPREDQRDTRPGRPARLQDLVNNSLATEIREKRCETCETPRAQTQTKLSQLPRVLVLHLKRYEYDERGNRSMKISRPVSIPSVLNLTQLVAEDVKLPENSLVERLLKITSRQRSQTPSSQITSRKRTRSESGEEIFGT